MARREWLTIVLMLPFVVTLPLLVPHDAPVWGRAIVAGCYTLLGSLLARFVAVRLTR
jgi:hypothetical protein